MPEASVDRRIDDLGLGERELRDAAMTPSASGGDRPRMADRSRRGRSRLDTRAERRADRGRRSPASVARRGRTTPTSPAASCCGRGRDDRLGSGEALRADAATLGYADASISDAGADVVTLRGVGRRPRGRRQRSSRSRQRRRASSRTSATSRSCGCTRLPRSASQTRSASARVDRRRASRERRSSRASRRARRCPGSEPEPRPLALREGDVAAGVLGDRRLAVSAPSRTAQRLAVADRGEGRQARVEPLAEARAPPRSGPASNWARARAAIHARCVGRSTLRPSQATGPS